ncbi:MAG: N-acetyltransferase family protein [Verrucomicrobiota bacterium]
MSPFHSGMNHWQRQWLSDRLQKKNQNPPSSESIALAISSKPKRSRQSKLKEKPTVVRLATESDLVAINDIYNHYVLHSTCTYQEEPELIEGRQKWFRHHGDKHPVIVAEVEGEVVGWGSLSAYHARCAYRHTVENSVYVHHQHQRRGIGALILQGLISRACSLGHRAIIAGIDADQLGSVALHTRFRFEKVGHFKQVGFKFNRWLDVIYMELILNAV